MLHRTPIIALALAAASGSATAVEYALPSGGYYQLQTTDTYETVCQSGSPCDVPAGTYTLLDFTVSPTARSSVTVGSGGGGGGGGSGGGTPTITTVRDTESIEADSGNGYYEVSTSCPAGTVLLGAVECRATWRKAGISDPRPAWLIEQDGSLTCQTRAAWENANAVVVDIAIRCARF